MPANRVMRPDLLASQRAGEPRSSSVGGRFTAGPEPTDMFACAIACSTRPDTWVADLKAAPIASAGESGRPGWLDRPDQAGESDSAGRSDQAGEFGPGSRAWLLALVLLLVSGLASAACTVGGGGMAFGAINPLAQVPVDSTGTITVTCAESTPYSVALVGALGGNGLYTMAGPGDTMQYGLYTDALRSLIWGDGTGGSQTVGGTTDALGASHTVYGRVPPQPMVRAGAYADVITVVVTF